jgi:hypothetical protein
MFTKKILPALATVATTVALAAPLVFADQKPDGSRTRYADAWTTGDFTEPPGSTGWGKGSMTLPAGEQPGLLVGVVKQGDELVRYCIEAELTGCIPAVDGSGQAQYWFGGLYGRMQQIVDSPPTPGKDEVPWFRVEGTWTVDKYDRGTIEGQLFGCNEAGTEYVCGVVYACFEVSVAMPGPQGAPAACSKSYVDRRPFDKSKLLPQPGGELRSADTITCPKGPDAQAADPPKSASLPAGFEYLRPFGDAAEMMRRKFGGQYEELPCSAGWRDVRSTCSPFDTPRATWPVLTGTFDLRYQLYE